MTQLQLDGRRPDTAKFSDDGIYRYTLTRELGGELTLACCGLNPSTATAEINDPTIRKDIGFAQRWGCGRVLKINADAYRATDPEDMKRARRAGVDIVGPDNDRHIRDAVDLIRTAGGIFLVAWGNHIEWERQVELAEMIGDIAMCLGTNQNGNPVHELYIPYETPLSPWVLPEPPPKKRGRGRR